MTQQFGNEKKRLAYEAIEELGLMKDLSEYNPILCGTLPIDLALSNSDLDIILEVYDLRLFEKQVCHLYSTYEGFTLKRTRIRDKPVIKANFLYKGFEFELFGQPQPSHKQYAYLHMVIEDYLMKQIPSLRERVILLKQQGCKTEPAFCKILGLEGDPYEALIVYGESQGIIRGGTA